MEVMGMPTIGFHIGGQYIFLGYVCGDYLLLTDLGMVVFSLLLVGILGVLGWWTVRNIVSIVRTWWARRLANGGHLTHP